MSLPVTCHRNTSSHPGRMGTLNREGRYLTKTRGEVGGGSQPLYSPVFVRIGITSDNRFSLLLVQLDRTLDYLEVENGHPAF
jgi:hypothetical protein